MSTSHYITSTSSFPTFESWDAQYTARERGRGRSRSRQPAPTPESAKTPTRRVRTHSADARPQYSARHNNDASFTLFGEPEGSASTLYQPQFASDLPRLNGIYHDDNVDGSRARGRSMSPSRSRASMLEAAGGFMIPGDPYQSTMRLPSNPLLSRNSYLTHSSQPPPRPLEHDYDHLKNSLIMFGDAYTDQASVFTGLSQQELLQKKRRDETVHRRKEKKFGTPGKKKKDRIVNIPTRLLNRDLDMHVQTSYPGTSRYASENVGSSSPEPQTPSKTKKGGWRSSLVRRRSENRSKSPSRRWNILPSLRSRSKSPSRLRRSFSHDEISTATSTHESEPHEQCVLDPPSQTSRNVEEDEDVAYAGDWLHKTPISSNGSEAYDDFDVNDDYDKMQQFTTPANDIPHQSEPHAQRPLDPSSKTSRNLEKENEEAAYAGNWLQNPISSKGSEEYDDFDVNDDFDHMRQFKTPKNDLPGKMTDPADAVDFGSTTPQHSTYYVGDDISFETNPTVNSGTAQVNPKLNANLPRQAPPSTTTRNLRMLSSNRVQWSQKFATPEGKPRLEPEPEHVAKVSPTSVMDLENLNLNQMDPMSAHLAFMMNNNAIPPKSTPVETAYATQSVGRSSYTTSTSVKPKSILRRGRLIRSDSDDCPSDETPSKSVRISDAPPKRGEFIKDSPTALGFLDNSGRELSPIRAIGSVENASQPSGYEQKGMPDWMVEDGSFARNIPEEYQKQFMGEHGRDDDSSVILDAYAGFIESVASVVVQTAARQFLAKIETKKMRDENEKQLRHDLDLRNVANRRQVALSSRKTKLSDTARSKDVAHKIYDVAAICIQAAFRGWNARDSLTVDHYCATSIQTVFRGFTSRLRYNTQLYCILLIQAVFRGHSVRKRLQESGGRDVAAVIIQTQWRGYACEMTFLRIYEDIIFAQKVVRGWITRKLLSAWLKEHNVSVSSHLMGEDESSAKGSQGIVSPGRSTSHVDEARRDSAAKAKEVKQHREFNGGTLLREQKHKANTLQDGGVVSRATRAELERRRKEKGRAGEDQNASPVEISRQGYIRRMAAFAAKQQEERHKHVIRLPHQEEEPLENETAAQAAGDEEEFLKKEIAARAARDEEVIRQREIAAQAFLEEEERITKEMADKAALEEEELFEKEVAAQAAHEEKAHRKKEMIAQAACEEEERRQSEISAQAVREEEERRKREVAAQVGREEEERNNDKPQVPLPRQYEASALEITDSDKPPAALPRQDEASSLKSTYNATPPAPLPRPDVPTPQIAEDATKLDNNDGAAIVKTKLQNLSSSSEEEPKKASNFRVQRSEEEQRRIDKIHETFHRVGLMTRQKGITEQRGNTVADTLGNPLEKPDGDEIAGVSEPSASDLIQAWRSRDQTLPKMNGKLF